MSRIKLSEQEISKNEIKFYLTDAQLDTYDRYLEPFGGKRGPFAKALLLNHLKSHVLIQENAQGAMS